MKAASPSMTAASADRSRHFVGVNGEMADLVRAHEWSSSALGAIDSWSKELLTTASLVLSSPFPAALFWGVDFLMIYNDSYRFFLAEKHPDSLGRSARQVWSEAWEIMGPQVDAAISRGTPTYEEGRLVPILKDGALQRFYWDYWFNPVFQDGVVVGIFSTAHNTTDAVVLPRKGMR